MIPSCICDKCRYRRQGSTDYDGEENYRPFCRRRFLACRQTR